MRKKWRIIFVCFLLAAVFLLEPVSYVLASDIESGSGDSIDRTKTVPWLAYEEIKFNYGKYWDWFGLVEHDNPIVNEELVLAHKKNENIDYSLYNLVCDFELKTRTDNEDIVTPYSVIIDLSEYKNGFFDGLLVRFNLKDDFFEHVFDYYDIVSKADGFQERVIPADDKYSTYNTVISQADFYFVRKSDGKAGRVTRYKFTWDSDFWMQTCTKIECLAYNKGSEGIQFVDSVENENGVFGHSLNKTDSYLNIEGSSWDSILGLLLDIPAALVALVVGFIDLIGYIGNLFQAIFPFLPAVVFDIFGIFILLMFLIAIYKMVFGD